MPEDAEQIRQEGVFLYSLQRWEECAECLQDYLSAATAATSQEKQMVRITLVSCVATIVGSDCWLSLFMLRVIHRLTVRVPAKLLKHHDDACPLQVRLLLEDVRKRLNRGPELDL